MEQILCGWKNQLDLIKSILSDKSLFSEKKSILSGQIQQCPIILKVQEIWD